MRTEICFTLNGRPVAVTGDPIHRTALVWLRAQGLVGTKEGCAEGDCGACTVGLGQWDGSRIHWQAVNACLLLLGQLDGKHLMTVEGLRAPDGELHPAQKDLAEKHGTQCGFCSPGFAMSFFALSRSDLPADREDVLDALAGNLCRCTGYRPLIEAAEALPRLGPPPYEAGMATDLAARPHEPLTYEFDGGLFVAPTTMDDALTFRRRRPDAWVLAGGTDLGLRVTKQHQRPTAVLSLGAVTELQQLNEGPDGLTLGAALPYSQALPALARHHPAMAELVRRIGSRQIRNLGTIGGNIANASPIGDSMPALIALGASVELAGPAGRRRVAAEDFITGYRQTALAPDELVVAIHVPPATGVVAAYKIAKRVDQDISTVAACFAVDLVQGRVARLRAGYGGMAATPVFAVHLEQALAGQPWTETAIEAALPALDRDLSPISDARGSADYRRRIAANLVRRFALETGAA